MEEYLRLFDLFGIVFYSTLNLLLPDILKITLMLVWTLALLFLIISLFFGGMKIKDLLYLIPATILTIFTWKAYFQLEVDESILNWFFNIPNSIKEYIVQHPWLVGFFTFGLIIFILEQLGIISSSSTSDNYYDDRPRGFSPSEEREYEEEQRIKRIRRNLWNDYE